MSYLHPQAARLELSRLSVGEPQWTHGSASLGLPPDSFALRLAARVLAALRTLPPTFPPRRPRETACGFLRRTAYAPFVRQPHAGAPQHVHSAFTYRPHAAHDHHEPPRLIIPVTGAGRSSAPVLDFLRAMLAALAVAHGAVVAKALLVADRLRLVLHEQSLPGIGEALHGGGQLRAQGLRVRGVDENREHVQSSADAGGAAVGETVFSIEEWQAAMLRAETAADKARAMKHLIAAAEERGRQRAIEVLKLMHLHEHVPSHVALLIGAIANIRALAPRDSAPKPGISDEKIRELLQRGERDRRIAEGNNVAPRDSGKESDHG